MGDETVDLPRRRKMQEEAVALLHCEMTAWIHNVWTETDDVQSKGGTREDEKRRRGEALALLDRTACPSGK